MSKLTDKDLHFVVSRLPRDVRNIVVENKLFVAGGFIRATICGEKPSDIDIFGPSKDALKIIAADLALKRQCKLHETQNAFTVLSHGRIPIQFVHRWVYSQNEHEKLLNEFDFTIAQSVVWADETHKWLSLCADDFYSDLAAKRLVYTSPIRAEDAGGSLLRVRKFIAKGYNIQPYSLAAVLARLYSKIDFDSIERSGNDSNETWLTKVIAGLLREVDPLIVVDGIELIDEHEAI